MILSPLKNMRVQFRKDYQFFDVYRDIFSIDDSIESIEDILKYWDMKDKETPDELRCSVSEENGIFSHITASGRSIFYHPDTKLMTIEFSRPSSMFAYQWAYLITRERWDGVVVEVE